jgi:hypothetical protein
MVREVALEVGEPLHRAGEIVLLEAPHRRPVARERLGVGLLHVGAGRDLRQVLRLRGPGRTAGEHRSPRFRLDLEPLLPDEARGRDDQERDEDHSDQEVPAPLQPLERVFETGEIDLVLLAHLAILGRRAARREGPGIVPARFLRRGRAA